MSAPLGSGIISRNSFAIVTCASGTPRPSGESPMTSAREKQALSSLSDEDIMIDCLQVPAHGKSHKSRCSQGRIPCDDYIHSRRAHLAG